MISLRENKTIFFLLWSCFAPDSSCYILINIVLDVENNVWAILKWNANVFFLYVKKERHWLPIQFLIKAFVTNEDENDFTKIHVLNQTFKRYVKLNTVWN